MSSTIAALLAWAVMLSGYPMPNRTLSVAFVTTDHLYDMACAGRQCKAMGWYGGGDVIYLDDRMDVENNLLHASVVVHEVVHWLQEDFMHKDQTCPDFIVREREAYGVQRAFLLAYGSIQPVGASMHHVGC